ncbi:Flp pilus assembly protein CpaB [Dietzia sp. E1]|uniref:Flp pilus assembly protein CpaB n=1 Tax=Dietzia sp. E1 TaxID=328361 RepID=UPI0015FA3FD7|nr:Flp pilus assembly protein CpaB [Dietzia sp. E1]MBB1021340.1 Flp pilus assembly protein CpaB [Dietzia sp. E1]
MTRRVVAAVAAAILALLGAVLLISYVSNADERAMARMDPVEVLVVAAPIAQGTPAEQIETLVRTEQLPSASVVPGTAGSLAELSGLVAVTDLQPGEQLLAARFAAPESLEPFGGIPVPEGLHQITIPLDSPRVAGGTVTPGDLVGVFASLEIDEVAVTHLMLDKILVTRVQGGLTPAPSAAADTTSTEEAANDAGSGQDPAAAPVHEGGAMVTLAVNARDAETIVFAAEHGSIWLSIVHPDASADGSRIVNPGNVFQ